MKTEEASSSAAPAGPAAGQDARLSADHTLCLQTTIPEFTSADEQTALAVHQLDALLGRKRMCAEENALLSASLDVPETLRKIAALLVPDFADVCLVELRTGGDRSDGRVASDPRLGSESAGPAVCAVEAFAVVHGDRAHQQWLTRLGESLLADLDVSVLRAAAHASGKPALWCVPSSLDAALLSEPLRRCGARSYLAVPLGAAGPFCGMITFARSAERRAFEPLDGTFALELARRALPAIVNARRFRDARGAVDLHRDALATAAHDLRSPLNAIAMTVQRLLATELEADVPGTQRSLEIVQRAAKHMDRIVQDILDSASIQSRQLRLECRAVHLPWLIQEAFETMEPLARAKHLCLRADTAGALVPAWCDEERTLRVLTNLLGNAIKFTPPGGAVAVSARRSPGAIRVGVRDTGPGIAAGDLTSLFEPYWKGARSGGIGLGLYIARGFVEAHGGRLCVTSAPGAGSEFWFTVPSAAAWPSS